MIPHSSFVASATSLFASAWAGAVTLFRAGAHHTGLPVVVVAALSLVLAWRVAKRTWHVALELAVAVGVLLLATKLGWIRW